MFAVSKTLSIRQKTLAALIVGVGLVVVTVAAGTAFAEGPHGGPHGGPMGFCQDMPAHRAGLLAFAEVKLGLTEAQKPAFAKLTEQIKASEQPLDALCQSIKDGPHPTTLPDHLAFMEKMGEARLKALQMARPAIEAFYAQLTPTQKETADHLMAHGGHHRMHDELKHPPAPPAK